MFANANNTDQYVMATSETQGEEVCSNANETEEVELQTLSSALITIAEKQAKLEFQMDHFTQATQKSLNKIIEMLTAMKVSAPLNPNDKASTDETCTPFSPIDSIEELNDFEENLKNAEFMQTTVSVVISYLLFSFICILPSKRNNNLIPFTFPAEEV